MGWEVGVKTWGDSCGRARGIVCMGDKRRDEIGIEGRCMGGGGGNC